MENQQTTQSKQKWGFLERLKLGKNAEMLIVIALIAVLALVLIGNIGMDTSSQSSEDYTDFERWCMGEQQRAEKLLSEIKGAGKVSVLITYGSGAEKVYAFKTESKTVNGVTTVTEELVYHSGKPILISEKAPEIRGIVVVAEGADDAMVKLEIVRAIMALYNVEAKYIEVFSGK